MATPISEEEFDRVLATFERNAFRLETRNAYALGYERDGLRALPRRLAGAATRTGLVAAMAGADRRLTREGKRISRVRVLAEPPSDYQRWELWAAPWHSQAGERIRYMPRSRAERIGLPL